MLHDRLREKDEVLEKKSKLLNALQSDKKHLEAEVAQVSERLTIKEKEISTLQRKVTACTFDTFYSSVMNRTKHY
jgi:predicted nuclease with TOPRIM domain